MDLTSPLISCPVPNCHYSGPFTNITKVTLQCLGLVAFVYLISIMQCPAIYCHVLKSPVLTCHVLVCTYQSFNLIFCPIPPVPSCLYYPDDKCLIHFDKCLFTTETIWQSNMMCLGRVVLCSTFLFHIKYESNLDTISDQIKALQFFWRSFYFNYWPVNTVRIK